MGADKIPDKIRKHLTTTACECADGRIQVPKFDWNRPVLQMPSLQKFENVTPKRIIGLAARGSQHRIYAPKRKQSIPTPRCRLIEAPGRYADTDASLAPQRQIVSAERAFPSVAA